jgi:hypothetical protein
VRRGSHAKQARIIGPHAAPGAPLLLVPGRLNHSCDPAPMRRSVASGHGGTRSVAAARLGSGHSRPGGPRTRIRLEGQAQAKEAILRYGSVRNSLPTSVWKLWKLWVVEPHAHRLGSQAARSGDFTTCGPVWDHSNGGRSRKILGKSADFCSGLVTSSPFRSWLEASGQRPGAGRRPERRDRPRPSQPRRSSRHRTPRGSAAASGRRRADSG